MVNSWKPLIPVQSLKHQFAKGLVSPLVKKIPFAADPWEAFLKVRSSPNLFFLDSVKPQKKTAAFSFFGEDPFLIVRKKGKSVWLERRGAREKLSGDFLGILRQLFRRYRGIPQKALPFFSGGAVGDFGSGLAWDFEKLPRIHKDKSGFDDALFFFIQNLLVFDRLRGELYFVANLIPDETPDFNAAFREAEEWIRRTEKKLEVPALLSNGGISIRNFKADIRKQAFKKMVGRAKKYIEAGDIYQANLSQRFSFKFLGEPETLYQNLRAINPSPFAGFLKAGDLAIVSASPERLIKKRGAHVETRPIAGTRPRGKTARENQKLRRELIQNAKERAEHIMLVDLERNDLGRVAKPHTVRVSEMMKLEEYSHVIHIVSNIEGELEKSKDQFDLLKAMFPGGTITGCPKIRCMEIIESLEPFARSVYTGSLGYLGFNGDLDLNIIIRTIVLRKNKGHFQVGAGIVYDSDPEAEYKETLYKGSALLEALGRRGAS